MLGLRFSLLHLFTMITLFNPRLVFSMKTSSAGFRRTALCASFSAGTTVSNKKKLLILGGTGFLGQNVCEQALQAGYDVVSLSRRGLPPSGGVSNVDYRQGDARLKDSVANILDESSDFAGVVHCIGLLFDDQSGLGSLNVYVSGSGSLPDAASTYETITRQTAFNAIEVATEYANKNALQQFPFCFTSAAEAGWPDVAGGDLIENYLAPDFLKRYLVAKRAVEAKLLSSEPTLRPIIVRPSLIYSMDRPLSFPPVGAFFVGNKIGLPFVDRPVTVQKLSNAMVKAIARDDVKGLLRYQQIDDISSS
jgi:nucleoside-diphosphate-sugar epimerase